MCIFYSIFRLGSYDFLIIFGLSSTYISMMICFRMEGVSRKVIYGISCLQNQLSELYHLNMYDNLQNNEKSRSIRFCMHKCMYEGHLESS